MDSRSHPIKQIRAVDRTEVVMPLVDEVSVDVGTGDVELLTPEPRVVREFLYFERGDSGAEEWSQLARTVALRFGLPWTPETWLAIETVLLQPAWEGKPIQDHARYVAGSVRRQAVRIGRRRRIDEEERGLPVGKHRATSILDEEGKLKHDLPAPRSPSVDPEARLEEREAVETERERLERYRLVLADIDSFLRPEERSFYAQLESGILENDGYGPADVVRDLGLDHRRGMVLLQRIQRKALRRLKKMTG